MIKYLTLLLLSITTAAYGQQAYDSTYQIKKISGKGIKDCVISKELFCLSEDGKLFILSADGYHLKKTIAFKSPIVAIAKDTADALVIADKNGFVLKLKANFDTTILFKTSQQVLSICITGNNEIFLITESGIFYPAFHRLFYENASRLSQRFMQYTWRPSAFFIDRNDNIWLGFDAGEWGGDIVIFSTLNKNFISSKEKFKQHCYLNPVRSFFNIDSTLYVSMGVHHMGEPHGKIMRIKDSCSELFESNGYSDTVINSFNEHTLYIGPATFNKNNHSIYFYCQYGVFKGALTNDLSNINNWEMVLEPKFPWKYGQPAAAGYGMNVSKIFFDNNKLFIISPENGLLVWDGNKKLLVQ